jgi:hypothetical protein
VEQEYGEQRATTSLAGRTVLPGEPFEAPAASQVPGPRDTPPPPPAPELTEAPAQWNFGPPQSEYPAPAEQVSYEPSYPAEPAYPVPPSYPPATYATAETLGAPPQYDSLEQYGAFPAAEAYAAPAPAQEQEDSGPPSFPAPEFWAPTHAVDAPPAYPAPTAAPWPAPPQQPVAPPQAFQPAPALLAPHDGNFLPAEETEGAHRKSKRKAKRDAKAAVAVQPPADFISPPDVTSTSSDAKPRPNKALIALAAVVVLGGAGYFGYTQLSKSDDSSSPVVTKPVTPHSSVAPVTPATPVTPSTAAKPYAFPNSVAGYALRTSPSAAALLRQVATFSKSAYPAAMGTPSIASYGTATTAFVVAESFHPSAGRLSGGYTLLLNGARKPATGNVVGPFTSVPPGAAGGTMACGAQRGASPISYCIWKGTSTVGMVYMKGSTNIPATQAITRELRAFGER